MSSLLEGLEVKRIPAVDGANLDGPEKHDWSRPWCYEALSRYERACILSHRAACQEFLAGTDPYCCIFEDDVFISPDFRSFINDPTWIPAGCHVMKLETCLHESFYSRRSIPCRNRRAAVPRSLHFGSAAYIISRQGAQILLDETLKPDRAIDRILFEPRGLKLLHPVYQLFPALCVQAAVKPDGIIFAEMESSVRSRPQPATPVPVIPTRKTLANKIKRELMRPFRQLKNLITASAKSIGVATYDWLRRVRRCTVPYA
jgi:glycosyl transferase family 25